MSNDWDFDPAILLKHLVNVRFHKDEMSYQQLISFIRDMDLLKRKHCKQVPALFKPIPKEEDDK